MVQLGGAAAVVAAVVAMMGSGIEATWHCNVVAYVMKAGPVSGFSLAAMPQSQ
jgi:hypothetical protein